MKNLFLGALSSVLLLAASTLAGATQPYIFHSTESAGPGDVIGLIGDHFGTGSTTQVWMHHVTGTESSLTPTTQLMVVNNNDNSLHAVIPDSETLGLYAVWVKNGASQAGPIFINKARSWGAPDLAGLTVDPNRSFRLFGRNLCLAGATPTVRFINGSTSLTATVTPTGSDPYGLHITAPSGLVPGTVYTITVNNGFGGTYGDSTMTNTLTAVAAGTDPFGLGVPWGADFATIAANVYNVKTDSRLATHAAGDGTTDDTIAIQNAIYTISSAGGGTLYFPAGTYILTYASSSYYRALNMASNVVLKGDDMNTTQLKVVGASPAAPNWWVSFNNSGSHIGFYNLCFYNTTGGTELSFKVVYADHSFAIGCKFLADAGGNLQFVETSQSVIRNCDIVSNETDASSSCGEPIGNYVNQDMVFTGNTVSYYFGRNQMYISDRLLLENNTLTRIGINNGFLCESGGFDISTDTHLALLNNTLQKGGTDPITPNGDGETILDQGGAAPVDLGSVTGATTTTMTDSTRTWSANGWAVNGWDASGTGWAANFGTYTVAIVSGTGVGQIRWITANTGTTLTLDHPWDEVPDATSHYSINLTSAHGLLEGNNLSNEPIGIDFYAITMQDETVVKNTLSTNGGITIILFDIYQDPFANYQIFTTAFDTLIADNHVSASSVLYPNTFAQVGVITLATTPFGTGSYGVEVRNNVFSGCNAPPNPNRTALGEGYISDALDTAPSMPPNDNVTHIVQGTIFQGNSISNVDYCYHLGDGGYNTTIWNSSASSFTNFYDDENGYGAHPSVNTVLNTQFDLAAYWKLDETAGPTSFDFTGNHIDGTWQNDPIFSASVPSAIQFANPGCLTFDGVDQFVDMGTPSQLPSGYGARTICGWGKSNTTAGGYRWISAFGSPNTDEAMFIGMNGTSLVGGGYGGDDLVVSNFWDTNWHFIALTYDGTTAKLYADGVLVSSGAKDWNLAPGECYIGEQVNDQYEYWNGSIDDVRIFNRVLSASEISNLAAGNP